MSKLFCTILFCCLALQVLADGPVVQTTPYTRVLLRAPDANTARTTLGVSQVVVLTNNPSFTNSLINTNWILSRSDGANLNNQTWLWNGNMSEWTNTGAGALGNLHISPSGTVHDYVNTYFTNIFSQPVGHQFKVAADAAQGTVFVATYAGIPFEVAYTNDIPPASVPSFATNSQSSVSASVATNVLDTDNCAINAGHFPHLFAFYGTNLNVSMSLQVPARIFLFGDSLLNNKFNGGGVGALQRQINATFGLAGFSLPPVAQGNSYTTTNWAISLAAGLVTTITNGGTAQFDTDGGAGVGLEGDHITLYYYAQTNAGVFNVSNNINGGNYSLLATINAAATNQTPLLIATNFATASQGDIVVKCAIVSGFANLLMCEIYDTLAPGAIVDNVTWSGTDWNSGPNFTSNSVVQQFGRAFNPQLVMVEEASSSTVWSNYAPNILSNLFVGAANADLLMLTPNPSGNPAVDGEVPAVLNMVYGFTNYISPAVGVVGFDQYRWWGSWFNVTNQGASDSGESPHLYENGMDAETTAMFAQTGLNGLGRMMSEGRNNMQRIWKYTGSDSPLGVIGKESSSVNANKSYVIYGHPNETFSITFNGWAGGALMSLRYIGSSSDIQIVGNGGYTQWDINTVAGTITATSGFHNYWPVSQDFDVPGHVVFTNDVTIKGSLTATNVSWYRAGFTGDIASGGINTTNITFSSPFPSTNYVVIWAGGSHDNSNPNTVEVINQTVNGFTFHCSTGNFASETVLSWEAILTQ